MTTSTRARVSTLLVAAIVATVVLAPMTAGSAVAADHTTVSLGSGGPVSVAPNGNTTITVTADASNVGGYQAKVTYDPNVVQITDVEASDSFDDPVVNVDNGAGEAAFNDFRSGGVDDPVLATLHVDVTAESGNATIEFDERDTKLFDESGSEIALGNYSSGEIEVDGTAPTVSNFSLSNPQAQDLAVSFETDESLAGINVSISDGTHLDGEAFGDPVEDNGTFTYSATHTVGSGGNYTATLLTAADAAGNDGANEQSDSVTGVPEPDSGAGDGGDDDDDDDGGSSSSSRSSGGGGGGGGGGDSGPTVDVTRESANQIRAQVDGASRTVPVTIQLPSFDGEAGAGTDLTKLRVTPGGATAFDVLAERSDAPSSGTPELDGQAGLAYFTLDHELTDDDVATARLTFSVEKSRLDAWGADPSSVTLYRYEDGSWESYETRQAGENAGVYYFTASFPGLSEFAVGADRTVTPTQSETTTPTTAAETSTETPTDTTTTAGAPPEEAGFPLVPVLALLAVIVAVGAVLLYRRRNAGGGGTL